MGKKKKLKKTAAAHRGLFLRLLLLEAGLVVMAGGILLRAFFLQATEQKDLRQLAQRQHERTVLIPGDRGNIVDRHGSPLAISVPQFSVYVNPQVVKNPRAKAKALAQSLGGPEKRWLKLLNSDRYFAWIKRQTTEAEYLKIKKILGEGVGFVHESRRYYPERRLAAHLLGFVGMEGKGLGGVELKYDDHLQGKTREIKLTKDARGRAIDLASQMGRQEDLMGHTVELTIDRRLQFIAENELQKTIRDYKAKSGSVVVVDPRTGEVLALANEPDFDPNLFSTFPEANRKNRALTDAMEPGSTFKVFTLARAFASGKLKENELIDCENGAFKTKGVKIHDVKKHAYLNPADILKHSSNIGSYKIAERLTAQEFYESIVDFGFSEKTGIELGGESRGIVRPPGEWTGATHGSIGFGHGIAVTPLQLVAAFVPFATEGELLQMRLVKRVRDARGKIVYQAPGKEVRRISIKPKVAEKIREMMVGVTEEGGTGSLAAVPGFRVAGKTATAQKVDAEKGTYSQDHFISSFVGFLPADNPVLLIGVFIDEPQGENFGGVVAAPCFKRIAEQGLIHLGIQPEERPGLKHPGSASTKLAHILFSPNPNLIQGTRNFLGGMENKQANDGNDIMPDLRGLTIRAGIKKLTQYSPEVDFSIVVEGAGIIFEQTPPAGVPLKPLFNRRGQIASRLKAKQAPEKPFASLGVNP